MIITITPGIRSVLKINIGMDLAGSKIITLIIRVIGFNFFGVG